MLGIELERLLESNEIILRVIRVIHSLFDLSFSTGSEAAGKQAPDIPADQTHKPDESWEESVSLIQGRHP